MKKRSILTKIAMLALAVAPCIATAESFWFIGEPHLPKKMLK